VCMICEGVVARAASSAFIRSSRAAVWARASAASLAAAMAERVSCTRRRVASSTGLASVVSRARSAAAWARSQGSRSPARGAVAEGGRFRLLPEQFRLGRAAFGLGGGPRLAVAAVRFGGLPDAADPEVGDGAQHHRQQAGGEQGRVLGLAAAPAPGPLQPAR